MFELILVIVSVSLVIFFIGWALLIPYLVHRNMTKDKGNFKYFSYKTFNELYQKYNWIPSEIFKNSLFVDDGSKSQLHVDLFQFDGQYYMFWNPISYFMAKNFIKNQVNNYWKTHDLSWEDLIFNKYT